MSGNRILFLAFLGILVLLAVATVILATGTPEGPEGLAVLVRTIIGIGLVLLVMRLARGGSRRG